MESGPFWSGSQIGNTIIFTFKKSYNIYWPYKPRLIRRSEINKIVVLKLTAPPVTRALFTFSSIFIKSNRATLFHDFKRQFVMKEKEKE